MDRYGNNSTNINRAYDILNIGEKTPYNTAYKRYRILSKKLHPDKGGSKEEFQNLAEAWDLAKKGLPKKKDVVDKSLEQVTLRSTEYPNLFLRHATSLSDNFYIHWVEYNKKSQGVYVCKGSTAFVIPESDAILHDGKDCVIRIVDAWQDDIEKWVLLTRWEA